VNPPHPLATGTRSLAEVHSSVGTTHVGIWRRMFAFAGPAYLVSVGYMDPGNWATDLEGGARFGYRLLWVLVMSNAMAVLLQTLSARLGIVAGRDLAQACRETYPRPVTYALWGLCEIAIAACDLAEVLGAAIALNLLFHLPLLVGVIVTAADTLLVLWFQRYGIRTTEAIVLALISVIAACFCIEIFLAKPNVHEMATGLVPRLNATNLYVVIGILGATVMPHNLYLHSALVQTRHIGWSQIAKKIACRYNFIDSLVALNGALLVNAAILVVAGTVFFKRGIVVTEIQQAYMLLTPLLGYSAASAAFAIALLCSGQSSTLTGTLAGQIVMEGFLNFRMRPWLRRLVTRSLAIVPAAFTIYFAGEGSTYHLLLLSQVILSMQLPFAVIPLIQFTSDRRRMGDFANRLWVVILAWITAAIIVGLNVWWLFTKAAAWIVEPCLAAQVAVHGVWAVQRAGEFLNSICASVEVDRRLHTVGDESGFWTDNLQVVKAFSGEGTAAGFHLCLVGFEDLGVGVVVAVRAECETYYLAVGKLWFAVENKTADRLIDRMGLFHFSDVVHVLAIRGESQPTRYQRGTSSPTLAALQVSAAHELFAIHHHCILIASPGAVGVTVPVRTEGNRPLGVAGRGENLIELRPFNAIVIDHGAATIVCHGRDVQAVWTDLIPCTLLHRRQNGFLNLGSRRRFDRTGIVNLILGPRASLIWALSRLLLPGLLL